MVAHLLCATHSGGSTLVAIVPDTWWPRGLRRRRKCDAYTLLKHDRLIFVRNAVMHNGAITVTLDMSLETLMGTTPTDATDLFARNDPIRIALDFLPKTRHH